MPEFSDEELVKRVTEAFEEARSDYHDAYMQRVDRWYSGYRGYLDLKDAIQDEWRSKLHPQYVFQVVETIVANMIEDRQSFSIKARPKMTSPDDMQKMILGAKAMELLLRYEHDVDRYQLKQRPFRLQASIAGLTAGKTLWDFETTTARRREPTTVTLTDDYGAPLGDVVRLEEVEHAEVLRDNSSFEVIDIHDLMWHSGAQDLQRSKYVIHRSYFTLHELEQMEAAGTYDNVSELAETQNFTGERDKRYDDIFMQNLGKDLVEVLEYWENTGEVITVANRRVLLRHDKQRPFWHGRYPFVVASSMPDLFRIPGISDVEIVYDLQRALWDMMNQRLDNLALINNAIFIIRGDIEDAEDFVFEPGARWVIEQGNPQEAVMPWHPDPLPAQISVDAERMIKGDIQDITGGMPFMSGTDSQVDNTTATGVSIFTSLGQRRLAAKKQNFQYAEKEIAELQMSDLAQFLPEHGRAVPIMGMDGAQAFMEVFPLQIQGNFVAEVEPISESMMRQERRAEKQALMTLAAQIAPIMAAGGTPINLAELYRDLLKEFGIEDPERYFTAQPPAGMPPGQGGGQNPNGSQPGGDPVEAQLQQLIGNMGVTASPSDAANPNADMASSPITAMQRAGAMGGGGRSS